MALLGCASAGSTARPTSSPSSTASGRRRTSPAQPRLRQLRPRTMPLTLARSSRPTPRPGRASPDPPPQLGILPAPSEGNFVLVRFPDERRSSGAAYAFLRSRGIIARRVDPYGLPEYLRFTMGTAAEISAALEALADFLA